jgi:hypothetical protein
MASPRWMPRQARALQPAWSSKSPISGRRALTVAFATLAGGYRVLAGPRCPPALPACGRQKPTLPPPKTTEKEAPDSAAVTAVRSSLLRRMASKGRHIADDHHCVDDAPPAADQHAEVALTLWQPPAGPPERGSGAESALEPTSGTRRARSYPPRDFRRNTSRSPMRAPRRRDRLVWQAATRSPLGAALARWRRRGLPSDPMMGA